MNTLGRSWKLVLPAILIGGLATAHTAPVPTIARAATQNSPTNVEPVRFSIVFSESVSGLTADDVVSSLGSIASFGETAASDGTTYEVGIASIPGDGAVWVSLPAGAAVAADGTLSLPASGEGALVVFDRTPPPPPVVLQPADGSATAAATPKFAWSASVDPVGIKNYRIDIDGPTSRDTYTTRTSYSPSLAEGAYSWRINCRDQAGNVSDWTAPRALLVDRLAPDPVSLASSTHTADVWTRLGEIAVESPSAGDSLSGIAGYAVEWTQTPGSCPVSVNRNPDWVGEIFPAPDDGPWWCRVTTIDRAGNSSIPDVVGPFLIDRTPPSLAGLDGALSLPNDPGRLGAAADWSHVTVTDAFDPCPTASFSIPAGALLPMGHSEVTVTLNDHVGNSLTQKVDILVYNTEPPALRILCPTPGERVRLGQDVTPEWTVTSLASITSVRADGVVAGRLDTRAPGGQVFSVYVVDSTGLSASTKVRYVVEYAERDVAFLRVAPDGGEETLPTFRDDGSAPPVLRSSDWLRVRCTLDAFAPPCPRAVVTFSLTREDPDDPRVPILERIGVLADDGAVRSLDLPLVVFRPGRYTLWLGFVDETSVGFPFRLVR